MEVESMKKAKTTVERCLEELFQKGDLTPAETKAALDGMELRKTLCEEIEDCEAGDYKNTDDMYSERSSYRRHGSYGWNTANGRSYGQNGSNGSYENGGSGRPRYGIGGWYASHDGNSMMNGYSDLPGYPVQHMNASYCDPYYYGGDMPMRDRGYSRHSVSDRAVEQLEHMMDSSESDYERQELRKYIRMIRAAGMSD